MENESKQIHLGRETAPAHLGLLSTTQQRLVTLLPELEARLSVFLKKNMKPSPAKVLAEFGLLPAEHQDGAVKGLEEQLAFVKEATRFGLDAYNEKSLVRMAMGKLSLFGDENAVDKILQTDVVEIFDADYIQVYRSYSCFALCNYSIAELVTYPWYELYERPSWVTERLLHYCDSIVKGSETYVDWEELAIPTYTLKETLTEERASFEVREKFAARMISSLSRKPYLLTVKRITPVEALSSKLAFL